MQGLPYPTAGVPVSSRADAEKIHKAFAKQQEAIDYAEKCNLAAAVANPTSDVEDIVKVGRCFGAIDATLCFFRVDSTRSWLLPLRHEIPLQVHEL